MSGALHRVQRDYPTDRSAPPDFVQCGESCEAAVAALKGRVGGVDVDRRGIPAWEACLDEKTVKRVLVSRNARAVG
jgi:hypothetical protein